MPAARGDELRRLIVETARSYKGVPFKHRGRNRRGVDCVGLGWCVASDIGMNPVDLEGYSRQADGNTLLRELQRRMHRKNPKLRALGDMICLRDYTTTYHVAIIGDHETAGLSMIHAWSPRRMVVEHGINESWREKIVACFEFPGVAEA